LRECIACFEYEKVGPGAIGQVIGEGMFGIANEDVAFADEGGPQGGPREAAALGGFDEHARKARVHWEARKGLAEGGEAAMGIDGADRLKDLLGLFQGVGGRAARARERQRYRPRRRI